MHNQKCVVGGTYLFIEVVRMRVHEQDRAVRRGQGQDDLDAGRLDGGTEQEALGHQAAKWVANQQDGGGRGRCLIGGISLNTSQSKQTFH